MSLEDCTGDRDVIRRWVMRLHIRGRQSEVPSFDQYLSNEGFVLLHQLIQVLLVLLKPLHQVHLLVLQQG